MRQSLRLSFFGMKDEFGFLRRQILLFDRTKLGRVSRQVFWLTMAVYAAIYSVAFAVPFEVGFRLEVEPDSAYMKIFLNGWMCFFFFSIAPVVRLTRRRLQYCCVCLLHRWANTIVLLRKIEKSCGPSRQTKASQPFINRCCWTASCESLGTVFGAVGGDGFSVGACCLSGRRILIHEFKQVV